MIVAAGSGGIIILNSIPSQPEVIKSIETDQEILTTIYIQKMSGINCYRSGRMTQDNTFLKLKMMNNSMTHILNG
jgi:hypothetical protein